MWSEATEVLQERKRNCSIISNDCYRSEKWHSEKVQLTCARVEYQICNNDFELMLQFNVIFIFSKMISFHFILWKIYLSKITICGPVQSCENRNEQKKENSEFKLIIKRKRDNSNPRIPPPSSFNKWTSSHFWLHLQKNLNIFRNI